MRYNRYKFLLIITADEKGIINYFVTDNPHGYVNFIEPSDIMAPTNANPLHPALKRTVERVNSL